MCILFLFIDSNPSENGFRLILALNRDEFYKRPAKTIHEWDENRNIIGGKDMQSGREGGTWFAIKLLEKGLQLGALLNISGAEQKPNCPGRGGIVADYLKSKKSTSDYITELKTKSHNYNAFNFVTAEIFEDHCAAYCTNSDTNITKEWVTGINNESKSTIEIGVSNSSVDKPFQKVLAGLEIFSKLPRSIADKDKLVENLLVMLQSRERHWPDNVLSSCNPTWGKKLSSIYVEGIEAKYGTRTHSIVLLDYNWRMDYIEVSLNGNESLDDSNKWVKKHIVKQIK